MVLPRPAGGDSSSGRRVLEERAVPPPALEVLLLEAHLAHEAARPVATGIPGPVTRFFNAGNRCKKSL